MTVRYWDASALVSLLVTQSDSRQRAALYRKDGRAVTWWASKIECCSALNRLRHEGSLDERALSQSLAALESFWETCLEVAPSEEVRKRALRLLRTHTLRAADALQLAAALVAAREDPVSLMVVASDEQLKNAAEKEGFVVL